MKLPFDPTTGSAVDGTGGGGKARSQASSRRRSVSRKVGDEASSSSPSGAVRASSVSSSESAPTQPPRPPAAAPAASTRCGCRTLLHVRRIAAGALDSGDARRPVGGCTRAWTTYRWPRPSALVVGAGDDDDDEEDLSSSCCERAAVGSAASLVPARTAATTVAAPSSGSLKRRARSQRPARWPSRTPTTRGPSWAWSMAVQQRPGCASTATTPAASRTREKCMRPSLDCAYARRSASRRSSAATVESSTRDARRCDELPTLTTTPLTRASSGSTAHVKAAVASRLTRSVAAREPPVPAALLTRTATPPLSLVSRAFCRAAAQLFAWRATRRADSRAARVEPRSTSIAVAAGPMPAATARALVAFRPPTSTSYPRSAKSCAVAAPTPDVAPVTTATPPP
mmetsp:Transcript_699/g.2780  ORF Transcript_699/g.2780 Transcript_699/m.2780 type:complete len:399 (-) Transcript_699:234-1430(-)